MTDLEGLIAQLRARFDAPLADTGVRFLLRTTRRPAVRGIRRVLLLSVWPADGVDNFEWASSERGWLGGTRELLPIESLDENVSATLARYLNGDTPPFA